MKEPKNSNKFKMIGYFVEKMFKDRIIKVIINSFIKI